jgi:hypothetical protein
MNEEFTKLDLFVGNIPRVVFTIHEDFAVVFNGTELFYADDRRTAVKWLENYLQRVGGGEI